MPAAIEGVGNVRAFASRKEPAWHGLGTVFDDDLTTGQMLDTAHLSNWNVRLEDVTHPTAKMTKPASFVIRDNPFTPGETDVLSIVGSRYEVVQNETLFAFGDTILDGGGTWETAGSIKDGTVVFGSMSFKDSQIVLDKGGRADAVNVYLLVTTSHDGSLAVIAMVTPVRVVCQNTLNIALGASTKQSFKVRHTSSVEGRVADAREALGITFAYSDVFAAEAEAMIQAEITAQQFNALVQGIFPKPEKDLKGSFTKWQNRIDLIEAIYTGQADGPDTSANVIGTAWGALNAVTEAQDWYRKPRAGNTESLLASASGLDVNGTALRQKAWNAAKALVSA